MLDEIRHIDGVHYKGWTIYETHAGNVILKGPNGSRQNAESINDAYRVVDHAEGPHEEPRPLWETAGYIAWSYLGVIVGFMAVALLLAVSLNAA